MPARLEGRLVTQAGGLLPCTPRTRRGPCEGGAGSRQGSATLERTLLSTETWKNNKKIIKTSHLHKCKTLHTHAHKGESAEKGLPARPPRCGPPWPWEDARRQGSLAGAHRGVAHGALQAAVRMGLRPRTPPSPLPPLPGLPHPGDPSGRPDASPRAASTSQPPPALPASASLQTH